MSSFQTINLHVCLSDFKGSRNTAPFCVLSRSDQHGYEEYARTEVQWYNVNPQWIRPFTLCFRRGDAELLLFDVYDVLTNTDSVTLQRNLGGAQLDLNSLLGSREHSVCVELVCHKNGNSIGKLRVSYTEINPDCCGALHLKCLLQNFVSSAGLFHRTAPFFQILRLCQKSRELLPIFKSAVRTDQKWEKIELPLQFLCGGDLNQILRIKFFDFVAQGRGHPVGFFDTTVGMLCCDTSFSIHSPSGAPVGRFETKLLGVVDRPLFHDYRLKGIEVIPMLAIDFSSSPISFLVTNRGPHVSTGLFTYGNLVNGVFDNLRNICINQPLHAFGFADFARRKVIPLGRAPGHNKSVKALMASYQLFRDASPFPEKAPLAPVFAEARRIARGRPGAITAAIILTNGAFCDLQRAVNQLVEAQNEPLIVVIFFVGGTRKEAEAAFKTPMQHTDGRRTERTMVTLIGYDRNSGCADLSLEARLVPGIRQMGLEWLSRAGFDPFH
jgi:hypothetical protein